MKIYSKTDIGLSRTMNQDAFYAGEFEGGAVFAVTTVLYTSMGRRMTSGPKSKAAPAVNALLLFLAAQFFQGIL